MGKSIYIEGLSVHHSSPIQWLNYEWNETGYPNGKLLYKYPILQLYQRIIIFIPLINIIYSFEINFKRVNVRRKFGSNLLLGKVGPQFHLDLTDGVKDSLARKADYVKW